MNFTLNYRRKQKRTKLQLSTCGAPHFEKSTLINIEMAFIYKAERQMNQPEQETAKLNHLGPGSYDNPPPQIKRQKYV